MSGSPLGLISNRRSAAPMSKNRSKLASLGPVAAGAAAAATGLARLFNGALSLFDKPTMPPLKECCCLLVIFSLAKSMVISQTGLTALWLILGGKRSRGWSVDTTWNDRGSSPRSPVLSRTMLYSLLIPLLGIGTPCISHVFNQSAQGGLKGRGEGKTHFLDDPVNLAPNILLAIKSRDFGHISLTGVLQ